MALKTSRKVRLARAPQASLFGQHRFDDRPFFVCHVAFVASAVTFIILPSAPVPRHVIPPSGVVTNSEYHMSGPLTTLGTDSQTIRLTMTAEPTIGSSPPISGPKSQKPPKRNTILRVDKEFQKRKLLLSVLLVQFSLSII